MATWSEPAPAVLCMFQPVTDHSPIPYSQESAPASGRSDTAPTDSAPVPSRGDDDLFRTDHLQHDLKGRSVRGGAATLGGQAASFFLKLGSTAVLARLLTPADFGLIAMVTAVTGFVAMFKDAGLSMATVQRAEINHRQISTLFWINLGLSFVLMLLVAALAWPIAWFYGQPDLVPVTLVLAALFPLGGLTIQHQALLRRQMRFGTLAAIAVVSQAAGVAAAITTAIFGARYWALVAMMATSGIVNVLLVWIYCPWRPGLPARGTGVRPMLVFGGGFSVAQLFSYLNRNVDNVLLGQTWGPGPLGFYTKAYQLLFLPIQLVSGPISATLLPVLSRLQGHPVEFRRTYRAAVETMAALGVPLVVFCLLDAESLVLGILGPQWEPAILLFRALGPAALMGTVNIAGGVVLVATGRTDKLVRVTAFTSFVYIVAFLISLPWAALGIAIATSVVYSISHPLVVAYCIRDTSITMQDFGMAVCRPVLATFSGAGATVSLWGFGIMLSVPYSIVLDATVFLAAYSFAWLLLPGGRKTVNAFFATFQHVAANDAAASSDTAHV